MEWDVTSTFLVFAAGTFLAVMFTLTASAMFPREHRPTLLDNVLGSALLYLAIAIVAALLALTVWFGVQGLRWYFLVMVGGVIVLFAPGLHDLLPERLREGVPGLALSFMLNLALHGAVWSIAYS